MVRGWQRVPEGNQRHGVFRFRGIPYAASPVANLCWAATQPAAWDRLLNATNFGNAAIQTIDNAADLGAQHGEDCLYLNVWTPPQAPAGSF
jgi:para-nitrobenzyl esterase